MRTPYLSDYELLQKQIDMAKKMQTILIWIGIGLAVSVIVSALWLLFQFGRLQEQDHNGGRQRAASYLQGQPGSMINGKLSDVTGCTCFVNAQKAACSPAGGFLMLPMLSKKSIFVLATHSRPFESRQSHVPLTSISGPSGCLFYVPCYSPDLKPIPRSWPANDFVEAFTRLFRCKNCYDRSLRMPEILVAVT